MRTKIFAMVAAGVLAATIGGGIAFADATPDGGNCLGVERSNNTRDTSWGNGGGVGGAFPGIAYDARFGGTDIYGQYISDFVAACH